MDSHNLFNRVWDRCHVLGDNATAFLLMPSGELRETFPEAHNYGEDKREAIGGYVDVISLPDFDERALQKRLFCLKDAGLLQWQADIPQIIDSVGAKAKWGRCPGYEEDGLNLRLKMFDAVMKHPELAAYVVDKTNTRFFVTRNSLIDVADEVFRSDEVRSKGLAMVWSDRPYSNAVLVWAGDYGRGEEVRENYLLEEMFHAIDRQYKPGNETFHYSSGLDQSVVREEIYKADRLMAHIHGHLASHALSGAFCIEGDPILGVVLDHEKDVLAHLGGGEDKLSHTRQLRDVVERFRRSLDIGWNGDYKADLLPENLPYLKAEWFAKTAREVWQRCQGAEQVSEEPEQGMLFYGKLGFSWGEGSPLREAIRSVNSISEHWENQGYDLDSSDIDEYVGKLGYRYSGGGIGAESCRPY